MAGIGEDACISTGRRIARKLLQRTHRYLSKIEIYEPMIALTRLVRLIFVLLLHRCIHRFHRIWGSEILHFIIYAFSLGVALIVTSPESVGTGLVVVRGNDDWRSI